MGQAKLAREAGLANNTVAAGYIELLADLMSVGIAQEWDASRGIRLARRPAKFPFIHLLTAVAWDATRLRTVADFRSLPAEEQGRWLEWMAAQEVWRRAALRGEEFPEMMAFWKTPKHELDFVLGPENVLEVKRGPTSPIEFAWFPSVFPRARLTVVSTERFETDRIRGVTLEDLLLDETW
ncbi:MAG: ATP-binding protein [Planctomycetes bacterium]|nr:ATP-binding protein [Planctomycetota bacterium]